MRTEKANCPKDKMEYLSFSSSKANLVKFSSPIINDKFKGK